jgi:hypothetical protein
MARLYPCPSGNPDRSETCEAHTELAEPKARLEPSFKDFFSPCMACLSTLFSRGCFNGPASPRLFKHAHGRDIRVGSADRGLLGTELWVCPAGLADGFQTIEVSFWVQEHQQMDSAVSLFLEGWLREAPGAGIQTT